MRYDQKRRKRKLLQMACKATRSILLLFALCSIASGVSGSPERHQSHGVSPRIYILRKKDGEVKAIILGPHRKLMYGHGGQFGTRQISTAGKYKITGNTIALYEDNGHKSLGEGHQTYLPYSPLLIGTASESYRYSAQASMSNPHIQPFL